MSKSTQPPQRVVRADGKPSVCLTMIVKDEARVIRRCLDSVLPLIDCWSIVDTGSSDGTQDIIRAHLRALPGALHERPWKNFGFNRSEALALARPWGDYHLIIDADETLVISPDFRLPQLQADGYFTTHRGSESTVSFSRMQFAKCNVPWRYEGVLHEVIVCDVPQRTAHLDGLLCVGHFDSQRNQGDPKAKYARDAEVLEQALKEDPNNARYRYYLARSYNDAGQPDLALENFQKRAGMGGWEEEAWDSLFQCATILARQGKFEAAVAAYLRAFQQRPSRAETLCALARMHRERDEHQVSYVFARQAIEIARPKDLLFVDDSVYTWRALDEFSIAAYWTGRYQESYDASAKLLASTDLPDVQRARVEANRQFAKKHLSGPAPTPAAPTAPVITQPSVTVGAAEQVGSRLSQLVPLRTPIRVLDVGASLVEGPPHYQSLVDSGHCEVIGFEPNQQALAELRAQAKPHEQFRGEALGDGKVHPIHLCRASGMNSILEPDPGVLERFNLFGDFGTVLRTDQVETKRLDELDELGDFDYIKLDVQGFERTIIENGQARLSKCLVVHTEAAFVPLYRKQPCFGEIDVLLRQLGYVTHTFFSVKKWGISPLVVHGNPRWGHNQVLDGDLVYVKSFFELARWSDEELAKTIHIMHFVYGSFDLAYYLMRELLKRGRVAPSAPAEYLAMLGYQG